MSDLISRQDAIDEANAWLLDCLKVQKQDRSCGLIRRLEDLPSIEQETAKRIIGCSKSGITMWYQCDMCHAPVDVKDAFCPGCGRRFEDE